MVQANNASKRNRELETMVDKKFGGSRRVSPQFQLCFVWELPNRLLLFLIYYEKLEIVI